MYTIETSPAPLRKSNNCNGKWKSFLSNMEVGDWFALPKKDYCKVQAAANAYLKGRYSLYKHPDQEDTYVLCIRK